MTRVCRRCHQECAGVRGLVAHDCDELYSEGSLPWVFAGEDHDPDDYVELTNPYDWIPPLVDGMDGMVVVDTEAREIVGQAPDSHQLTEALMDLDYDPNTALMIRAYEWQDGVPRHMDE